MRLIFLHSVFLFLKGKVEVSCTGVGEMSSVGEGVGGGGGGGLTGINMFDIYEKE